MEAAASWGLSATAVDSAVESLSAMVQNRPAACCCLLESYVAVVEDSETGEEIEQAVGSHAVLILGGDLAGGPSYVVLDPWPAASEVVYWSAQEAQQAAPLAWIEFGPLPVKVAVESVEQPPETSLGD